MFFNALKTRVRSRTVSFICGDSENSSVFISLSNRARESASEATGFAIRRIGPDNFSDSRYCWNTSLRKYILDIGVPFWFSCGFSKDCQDCQV